MCRRRIAVGIFALVTVATAATKPSVRATFRPAASAIAVSAADSIGLDSIAIAAPALDAVYTTQLSRAAPDTRFERTFPLRLLFPDAGGTVGTVRVTVTVRNTRGASASATIVVSFDSSGHRH